jgi:purine-binding chemotaxis protein CheW
MDKTGNTLTPASEDVKRILKERAKLLAREPVKETDDASIEVVEFLLADERYGIESRFVREVYLLKEFTHLPCTPPFVFGLINVRGQVLSVIDIKKSFGLPDKGISDLSKVIIIHKDKMEFGILADAVFGVREIRLSEFQPSLPTLSGKREEYLRGVTMDRAVILDGARLLNDKDIVVYEEV